MMVVTTSLPMACRSSSEKTAAVLKTWTPFGDPSDDVDEDGQCERIRGAAGYRWDSVDECRHRE